MQHKELTLKELNERSQTISAKKALVGIDGFIDKIVHPVDQRTGPGEAFTAIETISEFGARISSAAGKSANIELAPIIEKLGGNGPHYGKRSTRTRRTGALHRRARTRLHSAPLSRICASH